ncbi:Uncharacterized protein APZ42_033944 [Daphnia magna]|uniref:THAP-type domain-containing protein n=1 Tax=Daphnia magna TaxID=35525 RepID=A0A164KL80_9CRUS|nr:Uncharacterized protein APZ42_033944 [Daphnia magna]
MAAQHVQPITRCLSKGRIGDQLSASCLFSRAICVTGNLRSVGEVRFFQIPASPNKRYPLDSIIIQKRRALWLGRLNVNDYKIKTKYFMCNIHFLFAGCHKEKPCYYGDNYHPDWAHSLILNQSPLLSAATPLHQEEFFPATIEIFILK